MCWHWSSGVDFFALLFLAFDMGIDYCHQVRSQRIKYTGPCLNTFIRVTMYMYKLHSAEI